MPVGEHRETAGILDSASDNLPQVHLGGKASEDRVSVGRLQGSRNHADVRTGLLSKNSIEESPGPTLRLCLSVGSASLRKGCTRLIILAGRE
jgi:hypothetical protein